MPRIVCLKKKGLAQFTFFRFTKLISHSSFYLFCVNCAFLAVTDYAYRNNALSVSLGSFALLLKVKLTCDKVAPRPLDPSQAVLSVLSLA